MCTGKDSGLAAGALVRFKNSYIHEKPKVSLQFGQVLITILLFQILTWMRDNFSLTISMIELMLMLLAETLRSEARSWRLTRRMRTAKSRMTWLIVMILCWLTSTELYTVATIVNDYCWTIFCVQTRALFKVLPNYPRLFDSTLGYPGEGWKTGRQRNRNQKNAKHGPQDIRT